MKQNSLGIKYRKPDPLFIDLATREEIDSIRQHAGYLALHHYKSSLIYVVAYKNVPLAIISNGVNIDIIDELLDVWSEIEHYNKISSITREEDSSYNKAYRKKDSLMAKLDAINGQYIREMDYDALKDELWVHHGAMIYYHIRKLALPKAFVSKIKNIDKFFKERITQESSFFYHGYATGTNSNIEDIEVASNIRRRYDEIIAKEVAEAKAKEEAKLASVGIKTKDKEGLVMDLGVSVATGLFPVLMRNGG